MRTCLLVLLTLVSFFNGQSQNPFKSHTNKPFVQPQPVVPAKSIQISSNNGRQTVTLSQNQLSPTRNRHEAISNMQITRSGSM